MTAFYLSLKVGQVPSEANVAEATSGPTADVIVELGTGNAAITNMSRQWSVSALQAIINYILTDDPKIGGSGVLTMMP